MLELQREISKWKLESRLEDNDRYFYRPSDLSSVEVGEKFFVIGRKGSGKTAISEHLKGLNRFGVFTAKITFKNFPFNDLYKLTNDRYRSPNQYITLWKYLIYSHVAKMLVGNESIDNNVRSMLGQIYADDPKLSLPRTITRWTSTDFGVSVLGTGATGKLGKTYNLNPVPWIERVDILESILSDYLDGSRYLLIFDELDEDYGSSALSTTDNYWQLLTSLFKAVQDVRSTFIDSKYNLEPIVFLRDDIYEQVRDSDKNKWSDVVFRLEWNPETIKELLAFRISRAHELADPELSFGQAWPLVYQQSPVGYGKNKKKKLDIFDFITRAGCWRPRDYVRYMKATAERAVRAGTPQVSAKVVKQSQKEFSNYLRNEMEDEIGGFLPDISKILDLVAHIRKPIFGRNEFVEAHSNAVKRGICPPRDAENVLRVLFHFSVLGNQTRQGHPVFRYTNSDARLNLYENLWVHPGLLRAFQL